ncbi:papain fold toxin domain-containing protein [Leptolyngbya sp. AN03gr2]|uniref:papain fold toxin domain-containing protein n=1 Tax=Leptolyngbya sp. AN03gr2 TaxID=3423364 RepID=UPI003D311F19
MEPNAEQLQEICAIAGQYQNFQCVDCSQAIQDYLITQGIGGQRIELYTGDSIGRDSYIYDDSIGGDAISTNGYHAGIAILIQNQEIVFDNHHPDGLEREQWLANLMFPSRFYSDRPFQITETPF